MSNQMNIQWFPGHMTKARRMMEEQIKLVDAVCEVVDARIPESSRNPDLDEMAGALPRVMILNRVDQADPVRTARWAAHYTACGMTVLETDSRSGRGISAFAPALRELLREKRENNRRRGFLGRPLRAMVVGIPNVGKSSFINRVAKRKAAAASDRPGVTRGKQWVRIDEGLELLDTPGVLWPKFESQTVGENLAFTGAIRDDIMDRETLAANLLLRLRSGYADRVADRYRLQMDPEADGFALLEALGRKRGCLIRGGEVDFERISAVLLDEFRGGKLGRITLECPPEKGDACG